LAALQVSREGALEAQPGFKVTTNANKPTPEPWKLLPVSPEDVEMLNDPEPEAAPYRAEELTSHELQGTYPEAKPEPRKYPYPVIGNVPMDAGFPRAEVLWLVKRLERSEYERGQLKATNRRLLRRLRKLRHKRGRK
jgi:hypothetical protein